MDLGGEASEPVVSPVMACHLGGGGRTKAGYGVGGIGCAFARLKDFPLLRSAAFLKASNSEFDSKPTCLGSAASNDLTDELGLQLWCASPEESLGSFPDSTTRPK